MGRTSLLFAALAACGAPSSSPPASASEANPSPQGTEGESKIVVRVMLQVQPSQAEALASALRNEAPSVLAREGCERFELFVSPTDSARFILYEEWTSQEAFTEYQQSESLRATFAVVGPMLAGPPDSAYFESVQVGP
ncbi:MAG: putative quinol monooxygenase [Myxococcota bacterium]